MADIAAIAALVEPEAKALGFDLVRVRLQGGDDVTLQIMAERPDTGQLTIATGRTGRTGGATGRCNPRWSTGLCRDVRP